MTSAGAYRLVRLAGLGDERWSLDPESEYVVGRSSSASQPDIDLSPDPLVSRTHARLWFDGGWKLEDRGSRHGTKVRGVDCTAGVPFEIRSGDEIQLGESRLVLLAPEVRRVVTGPLQLEVTLRPATGYAPVANRLSPIEGLRLRNTSSEEAVLEGLSFSIEGLATEEIAPRSLGAGACVDLVPPSFEAASRGLQTQSESMERTLRIEMNGVAHELRDPGLWCLAVNEWSCRPEWWPLLASFVLPNHPAVVEVASAASASAGAEPRDLLRGLFDRLAEEWRIEYRLEAPHYATDSQKIRLPDQLLWDGAARVGGGTCLDLALFFAAALESAGAQPLVAIVELEASRHALVGCWNTPGPRLEPVLTGAERLARLATWIDPNACTRDPGHRQDFETSARRALELLATRPLMFGLDVVGARQEGLLPMPLGGEPQLGADVVDAIAAAHAAAQATGAPIGTVPLLIGLLGRPGGLTRGLLGLGEEEAEGKARELVGGLRPARGDVQATRGYLSVLAAARARAQSVGLHVVTEANLLGALAAVESTALDGALRWLGADRERLRAGLMELPEARAGESSIFEAPRRL